MTQDTERGVLVARREDLQHEIIRNVQKYFSNANLTLPETLVFGKGLDLAPRATEKHERKFAKDEYEKKDIVVPLDFHQSYLEGRPAQ